jgi:hypothetical protein
MVKSIVHPVSHQRFFMGRKRPIAKGPRFKLKNYLMQGIPAPPPSVDYDSNAWPSLSNILGNDVAGDCVPAGMFHIEGVLTGNAGKEFVPALQEVWNLYSAIEGPPGYPASDNGCDEQTALNIWQQKGLMLDGSSRKIAGWMSVDGHNPVECRTAIWLFENLLFGVELPDAWVNPMPSENGFTWAVAGEADPDNGHCFISSHYSPKNLRIATWGMWGNITDQAVAKYTSGSEGGELYCVISHDGIAKATQKCPAGFDWSQLQADFASMNA